MIAQFSLRLICGMSLMWLLMPRSQVTTGFFRIQMLVALGLSALAALTLNMGSMGNSAEQPVLSHSVATWVCWGLAVASFLGSVFWTLGMRGAGTIFVCLIAIASTAVLPALTVARVDFGTVRGTFEMVSEWSSAALLGACMTGMLLGHWYLTAPTMSIAPLNRLNAFVGGSAAVRLIVSAIGLTMVDSASLGGIHLLWLAMRWFAGIFGSIAVFFMVWRILKYRNTQAATGVLFVGVILTFIGEMSAVLLSREVHLSL